MGGVMNRAPVGGQIHIQLLRYQYDYYFEFSYWRFSTEERRKLSRLTRVTRLTHLRYLTRLTRLTRKMIRGGRTGTRNSKAKRGEGTNRRDRRILERQPGTSDHCPSLRA